MGNDGFKSKLLRFHMGSSFRRYGGVDVAEVAAVLQDAIKERSLRLDFFGADFFFNPISGSGGW